jgi:predicted TIM-barrel fold metal-dependent hydrolase
MDDPRVENLFAAAEAAGLVLTFHLATHIGNIYGLEVQKGLGKLEKALQKFPNLKFFAHSQTFWAEIDGNVTEDERGGYPKGKITEDGAVVKLMRKYPNLYGDISAGSGCNALKRDEEFAVSFLNEFQDRLMFGTDICRPDTATPLVDFMLKLRDEKKISETVFQKVARENIIRILDL